MIDSSEGLGVALGVSPCTGIESPTRFAVHLPGALFQLEGGRHCAPTRSSVSLFLGTVDHNHINAHFGLIS